MGPELMREHRSEDGFAAGVSPSVIGDTDADVQFDMLHTITRRMATAEDLDSVLRSITSALAARVDAVAAQIYLYIPDSECEICEQRVIARSQPLFTSRALHLLAADGRTSDVAGREHRVAVDSAVPSADVMRTRAPLHYPDARHELGAVASPVIERLTREHGAIGFAGYPLDFRGEQLGMIGYLSARRIDDAEFAALGIFADQAAIAIKNAYLFRERERQKDRVQTENSYLQDEMRADRGFDYIIGESPSLSDVLRKVRQVSAVDTTVLLTGETGTGKELIARAIHDASARKDRPMIKVNCGAIPQGVVESELFGHEKGAFTGALQRRIGRFELADRGTLFMDEVGELPLETQVKLLRVLQEQEFERVGSAKVIKVNARLIAATNRDLEREVTEGRYRADLFYRLNVFPIRIPPLRERPADIPLLVEHFLRYFQRKLAKPLKRVTASSLEQLRRYSWPGNIRELQNVLERACVLAQGPDVELADTLRAFPVRANDSATDAPIPTLAEHERRQIRRALVAVQGRVSGPNGAAALLGVNPSTLRSMMQKLGISHHDV